MARSWVEHVERQLNKMEKQRCSIEKPKLDSARKLRGVFYIDPDDMEFKDFMKKSRARSWQFHWNPPCLAKFVTRDTAE